MNLQCVMIQGMIKTKSGAREKVVGIYHKNCLDGTTAAAVLLKKFPRITLVPLSHIYSKKDFAVVLKKISKSTVVYIVDFSLHGGHTELVIKNAKRVVNIDHHLGAKEELEAISKKYNAFTFVFDNNRSGASLAWTYFYGKKKIPKLILYVEDSDIWRFSFGDKTRYAISYLYDSHKSPKKILALLRGGKNAEKNILQKGKILKEYRDGLIKNILDEIGPIHIKVGSFIIPAHNAPEFLRSDIGHALASKLGKAVATFVLNGNTVRLHFRGEEGHRPRALELAKILGGGGHQNAAAATNVPLKKFLKMIVVR